MGFALSEMQVTSEAFAEGCAIPTRYTREGENVSPSIAWSNAPAEAKSVGYYFWVCALNQKPDLPEGLTLWEVLEKIEPHVVGMNRLVGTYERR
ncbi:MAG: YbhB/YbcL family Raf kinase inhibitor-like protein [Spirochaetales bacterium]